MRDSKTVSPTGSYTIRIPANAEEDADERVSSYWLRGDDALLQISSQTRQSGEQVGAAERLAARIERENVSDVKRAPDRLIKCPDYAAAIITDEVGTRWLYVYAVWPDLLIFVSISHPNEDPMNQGWAIQALRSLTRTRAA